MSNGGIKWRFLIVEDKPDVSRQLTEMLESCVDSPDVAESQVCANFIQATERLRWESFDFLILDLKDDADSTGEADEHPAGLKVFDELKKTRFVPVIFYTALPNKVPLKATTFMRIVEKTQGVLKVREEIKAVLATKVPSITRKIEEFHRSYMWDFVTAHWQEFSSPRDQGDVAYLLTRRLATSLEQQAANLAQSATSASTEEANAAAHPMMMYLTPPLGQHRMAGDILKELGKDEKGADYEIYWLVLTPSCDFAQKKVDHVVLAKCEKFADVDEYKKWAAKHPTPSKAVKDDLVSAIGNNRKGQKERYKFLPGTFFVPDLLVDFQQLKSLSKEAAYAMEAIASLDSPFAESLLAGFSRYFGRLGTPDIDRELVVERLQAALIVATSQNKSAVSEA